MKSPFPGMDPYLEEPGRWHGFHNSLIAAIQLDLAPRLRPRYVAMIEERTYLADGEGGLLVGIPDVAVTGATKGRKPGRAVPARDARIVEVEVPVPDLIKETYLEVRQVGTGEVVTVIELLSPTNKRHGEGRRTYEEKRRQVLGTGTSLVEVDLIRAGDPMTYFGATDPADYRILVSRRHQRPRADLVPFGVREAIPSFPVPLAKGEKEPDVSLGVVLHELYERAAYDLIIDYRAEPVPPLSRRDRAWGHQLLARGGRR